MHHPKVVARPALLGLALLVCSSLAAGGCVRQAPAATRGVPIKQVELMESVRPSGVGGNQRIALVIGNTEYPVGRLKNPVNDARGMGQKLKGLGFEVTLLLDGKRDDMRRAIKQFKERLRATQGLGLFYFSGHGLQVNGINYLVPVDAELKDPEEVEFLTVSADEVLAAMEAAREGVNIVFLDACRDNPFESATRSGAARGLALMNAPAGTLLAYSTSPGKTASDGEGDYGVWTGALLQHIADIGLQVEQVLKLTAAAVKKESGGVQTPWLATNWYGDVFLNPKKPASAKELLQLARANADAGDYLSAITDVAQALESTTDPLTPHERDEAEQLRSTAQGQVAHLKFVVDPHSATVRVDGSTRYSNEGLMELNPGNHVVEVSNEGYRSVHRRVELNPASRDVLHLSLDPHASRQWLPWTLGGVAVGALVVSSVTWGMSTKSENRLESRCGSDHECENDGFDWRAEKSKGQALAIAGDVSLGIGLAAATSAVLVRYWPQLFRRREEQRISAAFSCRRDGCAARGGFQF